MVRVAVIGAGAWGIHHVRTMANMPGADLVMVCDPGASARENAQRLAPQARLGVDLSEALAHKAVDAVVLATPAKDHARQALAALTAGKHVLVEKPMALRSAEAREMVKVAKDRDRILMVGHLMLFHPAMDRLKAMVSTGELGNLHFLYSERTNLGTVRVDENALWSLAPHDLSMIVHLTGRMPESVVARGGAYLQRSVEDMVFLHLQFSGGMTAHVHVSWLHPRKERRLTLVGSKKMVEFDDRLKAEKLKVYDKGIDASPTSPGGPASFSVRDRGVWVPPDLKEEPLERECAHFISCISEGKTPLTDGASAIQVVQILEAAQASLDASGQPVSL